MSIFKGGPTKPKFIRAYPRATASFSIKKKLLTWSWYRLMGSEWLFLSYRYFNCAINIAFTHAIILWTNNFEKQRRRSFSNKPIFCVFTRILYSITKHLSYILRCISDGNFNWPNSFYTGRDNVHAGCNDQIRHPNDMSSSDMNVFCWANHLYNLWRYKCYFDSVNNIRFYSRLMFFHY